jgi:hypothetical protein
MVQAKLNRTEPRQCMRDFPFDRARSVGVGTGRLIGKALGLPFDTARVMHAAAARSGLIEKSILESRDFENMLVALEHFTLGRWARHV